MGKLQYGIIHTTLTPEHREVTAEEIKSWHMDPPPRGRGWDRPGYSDMIHLDGSLENLAQFDQDQIVEAHEMTWGVGGKNSISRHIVLVGGQDGAHRPKDTRTPAQKGTLSIYIKHSILRHPQIKWGGHYQFDDAKPFCPGWDVVEYLRAIGVKDKNIYLP